MKKKFTFLIAALALLSFFALPLGMRGQTRDTKTDVMYAKGFNGYTTNTFASSDQTAVANSTNSTGVTYSMRTFRGDTGALRGNQSSASSNYSCRNTTTYEGYYISQVKLTVSGGTIDGSTTDRSVVYFGSSAYSAPSNTAPSGTATSASPASSGQSTLTWTNTNENVSYFILYNLKTSGTAVSENASTALEIVWTQKTGPVIPSTTVTIDDTNLTNTDVHTSTAAGSLSATIKAGNQTITNATVTWESSDEDIATIDEDGVVTLVAAGTTTITASYAGESGVYGASNATYDLEVTDSTPFAGGDVTFVAGTDTGTSSGQNPDQITKSGVTVSSTSAALAASEYRLYSGSTTTISTTAGTITEIVFTGNSTTYPVSNLSVNNNNGTYTVSSNVGTWTGDAASVSFSASGQARASQIVVTVTLPSTDPSISAENVNIAYNATSGSIAYSINNSVAGTTLGATCDAAWVSNIVVGASNVTFTTTANEGNTDRTATFTLTYTGAQNKTVTVTQGHHVVDYAELPFSFNGGRADIANTTGLTQEGLDSDFASEPKLKFNTTGDNLILKINERPGELSFDIKGSSFSGGTFTVQTSIDGVTYTDLRAYTNLTSDLLSEEFSNLGENVRYIKWIYTNKSSGNVALGNIALTAYVAPQPYDLTVTLASNVDAIYVFDVADDTNPLIADGDAGTVQVTAGTNIMVSPDILDPDYVLASLIVDGNDVTSQMSGGAYTFTMPSHAVTISATAAVAPVATTYTLATTIENGRHYIITNGNDKAMGAQTMSSGNTQGNNRTAVGISTTNGVAQVIDTDVFEFVINGPDASGFYTIYDANFPGYLYAAGGTSSNHMKTQTFCDNRGQWNISFDGETNAAIIVANFSGTNPRNTMRYNSSNDIFSCYASGNQAAVYLYVKDETTLQYDFYKDIAAASNWSTESVGWNFIASPLSSDYTPAGNMLENEYDLYQLNNTTWENFKEHTGNNSPGFNLVNGRGYLYANSANVTLHFSGAINTFTTSGNANVKNLSTGWNLIGNPYNIPIYINKPYYRMNAEGSAVETEDGITSDAIPACTGVIVAGEHGTVTFSTTAPEGANSNNGKVQMVLTQTVTTRGGSNAETLDNAIVSFNENSQLEKFYFGSQNANIYIPQGNKEYAIVNAEGHGEVPVNFVARENGEYTLNINAEEVEMTYLHLIDNLTGADVDLLATPSYTFNARTSDYASRFKLVFAAHNSIENDDNFAFISNGQIILTEQGDAQVFDVMGRMISSHNSVNHITTEGMAAGVYVIRLTNGSDVKTQKIIVK